MPTAGALQVPRPRRPRVLVEKVPALPKLVSVQRATELDVLHGLGLLRLMHLEPTWFVLACCFVKVLQQTEVGAQGRPYQQVGRLLTDVRPSFPLVVLQCKVRTLVKSKDFQATRPNRRATCANLSGE